MSMDKTLLVRMPLDLHRRVSVYARRHGVSIAWVVRRALTMYLTREERKDVDS